MLYDLSRRPIIITIIVNGIENIKAGGKVQRRGVRPGAQFEVMRGRTRGRRVGRVEVTVAAARGEKQNDEQTWKGTHLGKI